ncbi:hypothetical protein BC830DRAFT_1108985 [Chytriomyces sp. MP71]|nr:hypothetical protein BC830DRAFT_1108985 [Chytriomyces sp. MP71]
MGQQLSQQVAGSTLAASAASSSGANSAAVYVLEMLDKLELQYEKSLGNARFLKTVRCRHAGDTGTFLVAKVFVKPSQDEAFELKNTVKTIQDEANILRHIPNAFPYLRVVETQKAGYMVRQWLYSNLYDRISTRPFLTTGEKIWITFQLLMGLSNAHAHNIYHGDIKSENVLVTSWNWAYLADFAGYKPTYLPEDNPADFSFYFDSSTRRTCYLAPERFLAPGESLFNYKGVNLTPEMDIFGLGCTLAELFLEGTPIFSLSQLLRYRRGEYDPSVVLDKIDNVHVREMLKSMIHIDPSKRKSADSYLNEYRDILFPYSYTTFLHSFVHSLSITRIPGEEDAGAAVPVDADEKIARIHDEFWRIAEAVGFPNVWHEEEAKRFGEDVQLTGSGLKPVLVSSVGRMRLLPLKLNLPNFTSCSSKIDVKSDCRDVSLILTTIICTAVRNTSYPHARIMALELLLVLGIQLTDSDRLDRVVPYLVYLLQDENALVRATAIKVLAQLLSMVTSITTADVNVFAEYILPVLKPLAVDSEVLVRVTYAACVANIAETALRFLELSQLFHQNYTENDGDGVLHQLSYDVALHELHESVQEEIVTFLSDKDVRVKRALLHDMARLCIFFGRQRANDVLLSHMITYLNDKDWQLRSAFFESIVGVGTFVGSRSLEEYILPLVLQSLTDAEEFVVERVLSSLTSLAELGLFTKPKLKEIVGTVMPLVCHPSPWIRHGAIAFIAATSKLLPLIDVRCILYPLLRPFLKTNISDVTDVNLLFNLKTPLSRVLYDQALLLAAKAPMVPFKHSDVLDLSVDKFGNESTELIMRLREFGMTDDDKEKLFAMKFYISKTTQRRSSGKVTSVDEDRLTQKMSIHPHTVFLTPPKYLLQSAEAPAAKASPRLQSRHSSGNLIARSQSPLSMDTSGPAGLRAPRNESTASSDGRMSSPPPGGPLSPSRLSVLRELSGPSSMVSETSSVIAPRYSETEDDRVSTASVGGDNVPVTGGGSRLRPTGKQKLRGTTSSEALQYGGASLARGPASQGGSVRRNGSAVPLSPDGRNTPPRIARSVGSTSSQENLSKLVGGAVVPSSGIDGRDGNIKMLLESKRLELFPPPIYEFGARCTPPNGVGGRPRRSPQNPRNQDIRSWRPKGILAAHLTEHRGSVNQLCVAPDHNFFVSGSDDGTMKIWDCRRLEKNVTNKARLTYSSQGGKIKSLAFLQNYHSIASASDNGSIHISRIEYIASNNTSAMHRYAGIENIKVSTVDNDKPVLLNHFETDSSSILVYATERGNICGLDLRSMTTAWTYTSPPHLGSITSFTLDPRSSWMLTGTHRGIFSLWDVRFGLSVKSWGHPSGSPIQKIVRSTISVGVNRRNQGGLTSSPLSSSGTYSSKMVLAAVGGGTSEMGLWDVENGECHEVWCAFGGSTLTSSVVQPQPSEDMTEEMNRVYGKGLKAVIPPSATDFLAPITKKVDIGLVKQQDSSLKSVFSPADAPYILTAGSDRKIRFWDLATVGNSYVVSGLEAYDSKPRYSSHPYKDLMFNIEYTPPPTTPTNNSRPSFHSSSSGSFQNQQQIGGGVTTSNDRTMASPSIINHLDGINDMTVTQVPYPMILSGGRDGVIKVFI